MSMFSHSSSRVFCSLIYLFIFFCFLVHFIVNSGHKNQTKYKINQNFLYCSESDTAIHVIVPFRRNRSIYKICFPKKIYFWLLWLYNWLFRKWIIWTFFTAKNIVCSNSPLQSTMQQSEIMLKNAGLYLEIQMRLSEY